MSKTLIETIELGSNSASITFSGISDEYDDLLLVTYIRTDYSGVDDSVAVKPNNSSANFTATFLNGANTSTSSGTRTNFDSQLGNGATATANTFSSGELYISNYTASQPKSMSAYSVNETDNAGAAAMRIYDILWNDTTAITSLVIEPINGTILSAGSTVSLYGITAGGDGTVSTT